MPGDRRPDARGQASHVPFVPLLPMLAIVLGAIVFYDSYGLTGIGLFAGLAVVVAAVSEHIYDRYVGGGD